MFISLVLLNLQAELLSKENYKAQIIMFIHFPNTKQSTTYGKAFGNVVQPFLDAHKSVAKNFYGFCNAADQGRLIKIINHLRNCLIKYSFFFVGVDVGSHVFPGDSSGERKHGCNVKLLVKCGFIFGW